MYLVIVTLVHANFFFHFFFGAAEEILYIIHLPAMYRNKRKKMAIY